MTHLDCCAAWLHSKSRWERWQSIPAVCHYMRSVILYSWNSHTGVPYTVWPASWTFSMLSASVAVNQSQLFLTCWWRRPVAWCSQGGECAQKYSLYAILFLFSLPSSQVIRFIPDRRARVYAHIHARTLTHTQTDIETERWRAQRVLKQPTLFLLLFHFRHSRKDEYALPPVVLLPWRKKLMSVFMALTWNGGYEVELAIWKMGLSEPCRQKPLLHCNPRLLQKTVCPPLKKKKFLITILHKQQSAGLGVWSRLGNLPPLEVGTWRWRQKLFLHYQ